MHILITNDDGINAPGLLLLKQIAEQLAGPDGMVWTVAPSTEQSGTGHSVSFVRPFLMSQIAERIFSIDGTPADCVLAGLYEVMTEHPPDLILSGINRGNNSGENALYSGTIGAALEASLHGITGIALSQYLGTENYNIANPFEAAEKFGLEAIRLILQGGGKHADDYPLFYNVNFPPCPAASVAGIRAAVQGIRPLGNRFKTTAVKSPTRRKFLWIRNGPQDVAAQPGTDVTVNLERYVSITPMCADLTAHGAMTKLNEELRCAHD